ncbi:hypothetical protein LX36DRAFT_466075 [Colletotrichum falcatum]|nr:hypothetical protein LX36DRAFT_466075 [Colletotrichum falcatum]
MRHPPAFVFVATATANSPHGTLPIANVNTLTKSKPSTRWNGCVTAQWFCYPSIHLVGPPTPLYPSIDGISLSPTWSCRTNFPR